MVSGGTEALHLRLCTGYAVFLMGLLYAVIVPTALVGTRGYLTFQRGTGSFSKSHSREGILKATFAKVWRNAFKSLKKY